MTEISTARSQEGSGNALPPHEEHTVQTIGRLHADHAAEAGALQRWVEGITGRAGTPGFVAVLTLLILSWILLNAGLVLAGQRAIDPPPFFWLQGAITLTALYMTTLILTTQRRDDQLALLREQLTLEIAILSEQKSAKIISLLEELRRDDPNLANRHNSHANELSTPTNPDAVIDALKSA